MPLLRCDIDVQRGRPDGLGMFGFPFFVVFASQLSILLRTLSSLVFRVSSHDILHLADVADSLCREFHPVSPDALQSSHFHHVDLW